MSGKVDKQCVGKSWHEPDSDDASVTRSGKPLPPLSWWKEQDLAVGKFFRQIAEFGVFEYDRDELSMTHEVYDESGMMVGELARIDPVIAGGDIGKPQANPVAILGLLSLDGKPAVYRMIPSTWTIREKTAA